MSSVYPEAPIEVLEPSPLDEVSMVITIVDARKEDLTKEQSVGRCMELSGGSVQDFYRVWEEIEEERKTLRRISPADFTTETNFKTALTAEANHLDVALWVVGLKAEAEVGTWSDLKAAFTSVEI